jgi:hypothetical protein
MILFVEVGRSGIQIFREIRNDFYIVNLYYININEIVERNPLVLIMCFFDCDVSCSLVGRPFT